MYLEREALGTKQLSLEVRGSWLRQSADLTPQGLCVSPCWFQVGPGRPWGPGGHPRSGAGLEARLARRWALCPSPCLDPVRGSVRFRIVLPGGVQFFEESPVVRTPLSFGLGWFPSSRGETLGALGAL